MAKILVIGAGPAGMMAAITAAENGAEVTVLEKMNRAGKKMLITGKGRCNITNVADIPEIIKNIPGNGKFLNSCMRAFDNDMVQEFFHTQGVETKVERGGRIFPVSDKAADAVNAMVTRMLELGVKLVTDTKVERILTANVSEDGAGAKVNLNEDRDVIAGAKTVATDNVITEAVPSTKDFASAKAVNIDNFAIANTDGSNDVSVNAKDSGKRRVAGVITADGKSYKADAVILATGGASYPGTGSTGDGYPMAQALGHTIVKPLPSLVPLVTEDEWVKDCMGLSLRNVRATLFAEGNKVQEAFGEMLFTHFGVSGPIILSMSRQAAQMLNEGKFLELSIDLKPALSPEQLDARIVRDFEKYQRKNLKNGLHDLLPGKLIAPVLDAAYLDSEQMVNTITKEERHRLGEVLKGLGLIIEKTRPIDEAIVTAGGVSIKEIDPRSMESKLVKNLYFAGEVTDIDGFTGGYNLQAAFSMGAAAGNWSVWNQDE